MSDDIKLLRKFLIQLFGATLAFITLFILVVGLTLVINSFLVGVILYFIDLVCNSNLYSTSNILFGASLLTIVGVMLYKKK